MKEVKKNKAVNKERKASYLLIDSRSTSATDNNETISRITDMYDNREKQIEEPQPDEISQPTINLGQNRLTKEHLTQLINKQSRQNNDVGHWTSWSGNKCIIF